VSPFGVGRLALRAISRNRLRSALTVLGVVIGVGAVIAMVSLGRGAKKRISDRIASLGSNLILAFPGSSTGGGRRGGMGSGNPFTMGDVLAIKREAVAVAHVAPAMRSAVQIVYGNQNWLTGVQGSTPEYPLIREWPAEKGRWFNQTEVDRGARVCVIGPVIVKEIYSGGDPLGSELRVGKMICEVIGVVASKGQTGGGKDQDDIVFMPITTYQRNIAGVVNNAIGIILFTARSADTVSEAERQVSEILRQRRKLLPTQENDFTVRNVTEIGEAWVASVDILEKLLGAIASVSLLIGGIGIMNIMYVSVTERTREIGIRRAIGARERDILFQFLFEAVLLSVLGGLLGVALGLSACYALANWAEWPVNVTPDLLGTAFGIAAAIGIVFGFTPARRAARLDPIDALRFE
jgi:putative ABC transport system permease protein